MSLLTKVFVVLTTVVAILIVPLMVAYVNNTDHFREQAQAEREAAAVAEARVEWLETYQADLQDALTQQQAEIATDQEEFANELAAREQQLQGRDQRIAELERDLDEKEEQIGLLTGDKSRISEIVASVRQDLAEARAKRDAAFDELRSTARDLQEARLQLENLNEQVRVLDERTVAAEARNQQLRNEIQELQTRLAQQTTVAAQDQDQQPTEDFTGVSPEVGDIRGVVTDVATVGGDETFVEINVGSNDQVVRGMNFIIHDGDRYIGSMVVTNVDLNASAGRITLARGQVQPNDQVLASGN